MATISSIPVAVDIDYPTSDGKPMAETEFHRQDLTDLIESLKVWFDKEPKVYASGNMLMYYVPGDKHKHVSPDIFVVRGVSKHMRKYYLVWEEGKGPDAVIELTSQSTSEEDMKDKFELYRDVLKVREYFLFDPHDEYLVPALQGFRLNKGKYTPIRAIEGRLPSEVLGLHLERRDWQLRLHDPATKQFLLTPLEEHEARQQEAAARQKAEAEVEKLRRELDELRRGAAKKT